MTDLPRAAQNQTAALQPLATSAADAAAAALAVLEDSLAYFTPEAPVVLTDPVQDMAYIAYFEAA